MAYRVSAKPTKESCRVCGCKVGPVDFVRDWPFSSDTPRCRYCAWMEDASAREVVPIENSRWAFLRWCLTL